MVNAQEPPLLSRDDPKTISAEALRFFAVARKNGMPLRYAPRGRETWVDLRARYRDAAVEPNKEALGRFAAGEVAVTHA